MIQVGMIVIDIRGRTGEVIKTDKGFALVRIFDQGYHEWIPLSDLTEESC